MKIQSVLTSITIILIISILMGVSPSQAQNLPEVVSTRSDADIPWYSQYIHSRLVPALNVGSFASLAITPFDDMPYISYYDATNKDLMLANPVPIHTGNCGADGDWWCRPIDGTNGDDVGRFSSMDAWGVDPMIEWALGFSYVDMTHDDLKVAIWFCGNNFCNWDISTVYHSSFDQFYTNTSISINQDDGALAVAFSLTGLGSNLMHAYPVPSGGNCGVGADLGTWQCDTVDNDGSLNAFQYPTIDWGWQDFPYIAYYEAPTGDLKLAYLYAPGGCFNDNPWTCQRIDGTIDDVGLYPSLVALQPQDNSNRIAYYDKTHGQLKYWHPSMGDIVVDDIGTSPYPIGISLTLDEEGNPIIAYQKNFTDLTPPTLMIARPYFAYGNLDQGNCGNPLPGMPTQYWYCKALDIPYNDYLSEANYVSVKVNSTGLARVAYSEGNSYYGATSLKFTFQELFFSFMPILMKP